MLTIQQELEACKEVIKEKGLPQEVSEILERDLPINEKVMYLVIESLKKLSLLKTILHDEDLLKLEGYELDGTKVIVDEVHKLLNASVSLHTKTH